MKQKMYDRLHIPDAEMEIIQLLWQRRRPTTSAEIGLTLQHRQWKPSTIHTLAMNLERKGIIKYFKAEGKNYYFPLITESDYRFVVTKDFLRENYGGSIVDMMELLLCDWDLTEEVLARLRELINTAELPYVVFNRFSGNQPSNKEYPAGLPVRYSVIIVRSLLKWIIWAICRLNGKTTLAHRLAPASAETIRTVHPSINFGQLFLEFQDSA